MAFEKHMRADAPFIIGNATPDSELFQPGFCYELGGIIRTVIKDVTEEHNTPLRKIVMSDGVTEIVSVETIRKDIRSHDAKVLDVDERFVIKKEAPKTEKKKKVSKAKKKVSKRKKKNG